MRACASVSVWQRPCLSSSPTFHIGLAHGPGETNHGSYTTAYGGFTPTRAPPASPELVCGGPVPSAVVVGPCEVGCALLELPPCRSPARLENACSRSPQGHCTAQYYIGTHRNSPNLAWRVARDSPTSRAGGGGGSCGVAAVESRPRTRGACAMDDLPSRCAFLPGGALWRACTGGCVEASIGAAYPLVRPFCRCMCLIRQSM